MKVAMLISGGVDSSVSLRLLKDAGHEVSAFYLKIWLEDELSFLGECPWEEDLRYVRAVSPEISQSFSPSRKPTTKNVRMNGYSNSIRISIPSPSNSSFAVKTELSLSAFSTIAFTSPNKLKQLSFSMGTQ